jgi:hypothetical protein
MEFDLATTAGIFLAIVVVAVGGLLASPTGMRQSTVLGMVLPSVLVFGVVCLFLGTKYGEYRATR